tara:strand:+ start:58 stop:339 length:282 start_codon:yes stop_codon:yes gene_type:complete
MIKGDKSWGKAPGKKTSQWKKNESIIAKNPFLRAQRDKKEGLGTSSAINTGINDQVYKDNFDKIQWAKPEDKEKPKFKMRVNGKLVSDPNEEE